MTKPKFELNFYAEAKVFEGLKVNLGYEYVQRKEYVIEEGNSSRDFGLGNISNLSVGASYTFLKDLSVFGRGISIPGPCSPHASPQFCLYAVQELSLIHI